MKTLNDIFNEPYDNGCCGDVAESICDELKQAGKEWIKHIQNNEFNGNLQKACAEEKVKWIINFFNLEE